MLNKEIKHWVRINHIQQFSFFGLSLSKQEDQVTWTWRVFNSLFEKLIVMDLQAKWKRVAVCLRYTVVKLKNF